jgi:hypothetical protein
MSDIENSVARARILLGNTAPKKENDMNDLTKDDLWNLLRLAGDYADRWDDEEEHETYTVLAAKVYAVIRKMEETK